MSEPTESISQSQAPGQLQAMPQHQAMAQFQPREELAEVLRRVLAEVLETMFFADVLPAGCSSHAWLSSAVGARVRFDGSHAGEMRLSISAKTADSIASAFLGLDPDELTQPLRSQVVLELVNIVCGAMLSHLWPDSKVALGAPEPASEGPACASTLHHCFELPDSEVSEAHIAVWMDWSETARP